MARLFFPILSLFLMAAPVLASDVEPTLRLPHPGTKTVALTLDACMGAVDHRILDVLVDNRIPATIFVTRRWLARNSEAIALLKAHGDLFEIENHGAEHVPAITDRPLLFGLKTAGGLPAITAEVQGGGAAVEAAFGSSPRWYRDAGARYSTDALVLIAALGYRVAGYSLNADVGASLPAATVARRIGAAKSGDVIIAHVNQPGRPSGEGVVAGLLKLQTAGWHFVRLDDAFSSWLRGPAG